MQHVGCRLPVKPKEEEEAAGQPTVEDDGSKHGPGEEHGGTRPPQKSEIIETRSRSPGLPGRLFRKIDYCERKIPETLSTPGAGRETDTPQDGAGGPLVTALPESRQV